MRRIATAQEQENHDLLPSETTTTTTAAAARFGESFALRNSPNVAAGGSCASAEFVAARAETSSRNETVSSLPRAMKAKAAILCRHGSDGVDTSSVATTVTVKTKILDRCLRK